MNDTLHPLSDETNVRVGTDSTDHLSFFCDCNGSMKVEKVFTNQMVVNTKTSQKDCCTWISCKCKKCGKKGYRKFYWTSDNGEYCTSLTED